MTDLRFVYSTSAALPFCNTAVWGDVNVRDVYCASRSVSSTQTFYSTYSGQAIGGVFTPVFISSPDSFTIITSTPSTTRPDVESTSTPTPDGDKTTTSRPAVFTTDSPIPAKKSTPVGPIVGGAIGGVALLALAGLGIFMLKRRNRRNAAAAGSAAVVHTDSHGHAPPPVYMGNQNTAYNQNAAVPLPPHASEIDGSAIGKPPPMASVSEHGYFAPAPAPKPYGDGNQYGQNIQPTDGVDGRRTSAVSPVSPHAHYNSTVPTGSSPSMTGRESYVSAPGHETYPSYPPPGAHEMPGNEIRRE